jgi:hypothetical protein
MLNNCSLGGSFKSWVVLVAVLSLCTPKIWSDSISITESEKDSLKCTNKVSCGTLTTGKFAMKGKFFTERDLSNLSIDTNTALDVTIGHWSKHLTFADASKFKVGNQSLSATFSLTDTNSCKTKDVTHGTIKIQGSSKAASNGIQITVSTKTGDTACEAFEDPAIVGDFAGDSGSVTGVVAVGIDIGSGTVATNINVTFSGSASVKTVVKNGLTNHLDSVTVSGKE